jgi:RNA polymerase sigma factor (sigma-70 family)
MQLLALVEDMRLPEPAVREPVARSDTPESGAAAFMVESKSIEATPSIRASDQLRGSMQSRLTRVDDTRARFRQDIMPQLDAAYNFARFLSRDADAAQDIVQEAFLRAYRGYHGYQGGDARTWVFTIVRNCYHDWLIGRRRKARVEVDVHRSDNSNESSIDDVPSGEDSPEAALMRKAESNTVRIVLNTLPRSQREILVLRELEGLSYRQIAEVAALPIGTVMSRLARARREFAGAWRREASFQGNPIQAP